MSTTVTYKGETLTTVNNQTRTLETAGTYLEDDITLVDVSQSAPVLQAKTNIAPTTSSQTITADSGYDGLSSVQISAMPSGSASTPATTITAPPTLSVANATGIVTASISKTQSVTPSVSAGYVASGTAGNITVSGSNTLQLTTQAATTITPTTSVQTAVPSGRFTTGAVTVAAIPTGTAGTPTATKGTVSNHAVSVTPSVTNTTGYITGGTKTGTAVSVSASELVSGTKSITENGTGIDVTDYASVDVAVPSSAPTLQAKTNIDPTTSSQTITPDTGYDGLSSVQINAMPRAQYDSVGVRKTVDYANHSVDVYGMFPVSNGGYIPSGNYSGAVETITAAQLVSGALSITSNGNFNVTNYAGVNVDVSGGGGGNPITLTIYDVMGMSPTLYVPTSATWTGFEVDYDTGQVYGTLTIMENDMFVITGAVGLPPPSSSVTTFTQLNVGSRATKTVYLCYCGTLSGTITC